ncbi:MAG: hypothetical protein ACXWOV_07735, partial [Isosphaeraceae bacterium]
QKRLVAQKGHFVNSGLLDSQFEILEPPEDAIRVDVTGTPEEIAGAIRRSLGLLSGHASSVNANNFTLTILDNYNDMIVDEAEPRVARTSSDGYGGGGGRRY